MADFYHDWDDEVALTGNASYVTPLIPNRIAPRPVDVSNDDQIDNFDDIQDNYDSNEEENDEDVYFADAAAPRAIISHDPVPEPTTMDITHLPVGDDGLDDDFADGGDFFYHEDIPERTDIYRYLRIPHPKKGHVEICLFFRPDSASSGKLKVNPYIDIQSVDNDSFITLRIKTALEKMLEVVGMEPQEPGNTFSVIGMPQRNDDEIDDDIGAAFLDL